MLGDFILRSKKIKDKLKSYRPVLVSSQVLRDEIRSLSNDYFRKIRPIFSSPIIESEEAQDLELIFKNVFYLSGERNRKSTYLKLFNKIDKNLKKIEIYLVSNPKPILSILGDREEKIFNTLFQLVPAAANSYKQAVYDLFYANDRYSFRGTANEIRESISETLKYLAPDVLVVAEPGFKYEKDQRTGGLLNAPTRSQRLQYILRNRNISKDQAKPSVKAIDVLEQYIINFFTSAYERANMSSHISTERAEVEKIKWYADLIFSEILQIN